MPENRESSLGTPLLQRKYSRIDFNDMLSHCVQAIHSPRHCATTASTVTLSQRFCVDSCRVHFLQGNLVLFLAHCTGTSNARRKALLRDDRAAAQFRLVDFVGDGDARNNETVAVPM